MSDRLACLWCESSFEPRRGGSPQRFCAPKCRTAFWTALRRWAERAVAADTLTIADLKSGVAAACTLPARGETPRPGPNMLRDGTLSPDAPLRFIVEVERGLVDGLVRLGFIRSDERGELGAIIAGMKRLGWAPSISRIA
jgi:hypothetical protein